MAKEKQKVENKKTSKNTKKVEVKKAKISKTKPEVKEQKSLKSKPKKVETKTSKNVKKTEKMQKNAENLQKNAQKSEKVVKIDGFNNLKLHTVIFDKVQNPKAVVLVIHGMQEHCGRYENFAKFLNSKGFVVVLSDLRGHGKTMLSKEDYGKGEQDIFQECLVDQANIIDYICKNYNLPLYVFGHSFGSMLTQILLQTCPQIKKAVLCGTTNGGCMQFKLGNLLITMMNPFKNQDKRGGIAEKLCIKSFEKGFKDGNWFSRDEKVFEEYKNDEFCGGSFPFSFYRSMIKNMVKANGGIEKIKDKKIFLIAGSDDPVGQKGKQVKKLLKIYLRCNIDAKMKLYDGARHELLNETNKNEVFDDVVKFFES